MPQTVDQFEPGQRVVVTQQISRSNEVWTIQVAGEVVRYEQRKTGSWFARSKDDKLWLDRLVLRKDDGEIVACILDPYTHVEAVDAPVAAAAKPLPETPAGASDSVSEGGGGAAKAG